MVEAIVAAERNVAHRIIEEFMLLANETVAAHLDTHDVPTLYRVHEDPDPMKVEEFEEFIATLGYTLNARADAVKPRDFQQLVEKMRGKPEEKPIAFLMLRTMQKARYDPENLGHFGLAAASYTHFTSPIRRYPDLVVHRTLRESRHGRMDENRREELTDDLPEIARHTSERERRADDAERELVQWKKVRFMADKVGRRVRRLHHRRRGLRPVHRAGRALRRRAGAHLDDGRRLLPVRRAGAHPARREHRQGLPARRSGERAGREGGHGAAPGRSGARGDPRSGSRIRAPPRPAPEPRGPRTARGCGRTAGRAGPAHVEEGGTAHAAGGTAGARRTERAPLSAGRSIVVGTAGHIDHGKSALVRALTGIDPDRLKEEKARGITIDLGFAHAEAEGVTLAFVDVPGHERFVKNMLAGAGGIDLVLLVVAADESVMPQTREHFQICRLLQVPAGLVVLTKSDLADGDLLEIARMEVAELVAGSFLEGAPVVAASSKTGAGLDQVRHTLAALARGIPERRSGGAVRLPIDRVFSVRGFGTVVTGTLVAGEIHVGDELVAEPRGLAVKVRGLQVHGAGAPEAAAGRRLAVNLGGVDVGELSRGDTLSTPAALEPTQRLDAILDLLAEARPLKHGARVRFHQGTTELLGRVAIAASRPPGAAVTEVAPGASAYVRLRLERPAALTRGDRFIVRAYSPSVTIGGGVVIDPHPPRSAIRTEAGVARLRRIDAGSAAGEAVLSFIDEAGAAGLPRGALASRAGLTPSEGAAVAGELTAAKRVTAVGDLLVASAAIDGLGRRLLAALDDHHRANPLSEGLPREEARERFFGRAAPEVFEHVLGALAAEQRIVARDRVALAGHQVSLTPEEAAAADALDRIYREAGLTPPDLAGAAAAARISTTVADRVVKLLLRQKTLIRIEALLFHGSALSTLKAEVAGLKGTGAAGARVDVAAFKERYGISRKYAIPLLEYLDRERVTRRVGDGRIVL